MMLIGSDHVVSQAIPAIGFYRRLLIFSGVSRVLKSNKRRIEVAGAPEAL
jgi:hypothetical protein